MKALFFSILIFNTAFFLWEYRIGAPEIYYPQEEKQILVENTQQIIFLPEEMNALDIEVAEIETLEQEPVATETEATEQDMILVSETKENAEVIVLANAEDKPELESIVDKVEEQGGATENLETAPTEPENKEIVLLEEPAVVAVNEVEQTVKIIPEKDVAEPEADAVLDKTAEALTELCFQVPERALEPVKAKIAGHQFNIIQQTERGVNYYFLLTERSQSLDLMKASAELIKQKGLEVWLIEKGEFSQRISLGVFSKQENVNNAKIAYKKKIGQPLEIIPQYKNKEISYLKLSLAKDKLKEFNAVISEYQLKPKQCSEIIKE